MGKHLTFETWVSEKFIKIWNFYGCHDIQHSDNQHNDTQLNDIQSSDIQHKNELNTTLSLMTFSIITLCLCREY
jgi:hypothetical protein